MEFEKMETQPKAAILIRTSTTEQHPEKQLDECKEFADKRGYKVINILTEHVSAYKKVSRPAYDRIKELARTRKIDAVIVWAFDRWIRNRETLIEDVSILRTYGVKLHSVQEAWLEAINIEGPMGTTITDLLLGMVGSIAELESSRKSERVKMSFKSHKGKKWGRPRLPSLDVKIMKLHNEGMTIRDIKENATYWDKNRNKKRPSLGYVHKIITESQLNQV